MLSERHTIYSFPLHSETHQSTDGICNTPAISSRSVDELQPEEMELYNSILENSRDFNDNNDNELTPEVHQPIDNENIDRSNCEVFTFALYPELHQPSGGYSSSSSGSSSSSSSGSSGSSSGSSGSSSGSSHGSSSGSSDSIYRPLEFWFNRNPGSSLPPAALPPLDQGTLRRLRHVQRSTSGIHIQEFRMLFGNANENDVTTIEIDPNRCDLNTLMDIFKNNPSKIINFKYHDKSNNGMGHGADRCCKSILIKRVFDQYFRTVNRWFLIPKWKSQVFNSENIGLLMRFIQSCIISNVLIPGHLHPSIVEAIISRELTTEEIMYYLNNIDPIIHKHANELDESYKLNPKAFNECIDPGYESWNSMIRDKVIDIKLNEKELDIAKRFDLGPIEYKDAIELDKVISEPYNVTNQMVKEVFRINYDNPKYQEMWDQMIMELSQNELKSMLTLFTGTSKITEKIRLNIDQNEKNDLTIHACFYSSTVHEKLFESQDTLNRLKIYFSDSNDTINDYPNLNENQLPTPNDTINDYPNFHENQLPTPMDRELWLRNYFGPASYVEDIQIPRSSRNNNNYQREDDLD